METKFQTSFIPKKPLITSGVGGVGATFVPRKQHQKLNLFLNASLLLFVLSLGAAGGMYAWKSVALSEQDGLKRQLSKKQEQFNPDLIEELKRANVKIDAAKQLLKEHLAISNIFGIISGLTIERVRFNNLDLTVQNTHPNDIKISLNGYGTDLSAVAFQSQVLSQLEQYGLRKIVKNPILSNPSLDPNGLVSFGFSASIDPTTLSYENSLSGSSSPSGVQRP